MERLAEQERQRVINNKLQRLELDLIDIEEGLRFSQRGPTSLRENFCKCLKAFYEIDEFVVGVLDDYVYSLLRKSLDCLSTAFCKAMDILTNTDDMEKSKHKQQQIPASVVSQPVSSVAVTARTQGLGGVRLLGSCERGIEEQFEKLEIQAEKTAIKTISKLQDREEDNQIEKAMNEIRAYMNGHFCRMATPEGCMQTKLLSILNYFTNCEKQAVSFLEDRHWQETIDSDIGFLSVLNSLEQKKDTRDKFQSRFRTVVELLQRLLQQSRLQDGKERLLREALMEKDLALERNRNTKNSIHKEMVTQSVQTTEAMEMATLQEFINEKILSLESEVRRNQTLLQQVTQYKEMLEDERSNKNRYRQDAERVSVELARIREAYDPLTQEMANLQLQYLSLKDKLDKLWNTDIKDCVEQHTKSYSMDMKLSVLHIVEAILTKLGMIRPSQSDGQKTKPKFKFRVGMFKTIETPDLYEQFVEDVNDTKDELAAIRDARRARQKSRKLLPTEHQVIQQDNNEEIESMLMSRSVKEDDADCVSKHSISEKEINKEKIEHEPPKLKKEPSMKKQSGHLPQRTQMRSSESVHAKSSKKKKSALSQTVGSSSFGNFSPLKQKQRDDDHKLSKYKSGAQPSPVRKNTAIIEYVSTPIVTAVPIPPQQWTQTEEVVVAETAVNTLQPVNPEARVIHCQQEATQTQELEKVDGQCSTDYVEPQQWSRGEKLLVMSNKPLQNGQNNPQPTGYKRRLHTEMGSHQDWKRSSDASFGRFRKQQTSELGMDSTKDLMDHRLSQECCYRIGGEESYANLQSEVLVSDHAKQMHRRHTKLEEDHQRENNNTAKHLPNRISDEKKQTGRSNTATLEPKTTSQAQESWLHNLFETKIDRLTTSLLRAKKGRKVAQQISQLAATLNISLRITPTNIPEIIRQAVSAHKLSCHSEICEHLKRFYANLKKLACGGSTLREAISLRPLVIRGIECHGAIKQPKPFQV